MRKCRIKVFDYTNVLGESDGASIKAYDVEAWCVQGETGFKALFLYDRFVVEANGDDGHWCVTGIFDKHWIKEVSDMTQAMLIEVTIGKLK